MNFRSITRYPKIVFTLILMLLFGVHQTVQATHLRAGEIIVERVNCQSLTFRITIIVYTDTGSDVKFGEGFLDFGDGSDPIQLPQIDNTTRPDLGDEVATAQFTITHTYSSPGKYKIGYVEPNRNEGVLNIDNSVNTTFYVETEINIDPFLGCNNSPILLIPPIDVGCTNVAFFHNPGAFDPDGDSISFEIVTPKKEIGTFVDGYIPVNDPSFYESGQGSEGGGDPIFEIDPITGEITWDAPGTVGEYNIAFIVKEFRQIGGQWFQLGFVTRDMQIIVEDCDNDRPELIIPDDICVEAGESIDEIIFGTDPDGDPVKIEAFSQIFEIGASVDPDDGSFQPSVPQAELRFNWETECVDVRQQPYQVVFKITDNPPVGPKLVSFATWNITVVGPSPDLLPVQQVGQNLELTWDEYICQNAVIMQVWRRVDENPYDPDECETGIRQNAGYTLIDELPITSTSYIDDNLAAAAKYCYRLVAVFSSPEGGESIVSNEQCFEFIPAEEPVITHVSIRRTDEINGEVVVAWREPFELGNLMPPYTFKVYRADGAGGGNFVEVSEITTSNNDSTSLSIVDTGMNTLDNVYSYRISLVDPDGSGDGDEIFSAVASTVRLEPTPLFKKIEINWTANVPWSNTISFPPGSQHLVYRGLEGEAEADLQFLAAVDVTQFGFSFVDSVDLEDDQVYCYKVLTKGTYGNPEITSPLFNFSQMTCAQPSDTIPPCEPVVNIEGPSCENNELIADLCTGNSNVFRNTITWSTEFLGECQDDIRTYEIYFSNSTDGEFSLIGSTRETVFVHTGLPSYKGCYKVKAIDRSGNESEFSNDFCVDNCPYYELPNVFTPGLIDGHNDIFRAFDNQSSSPEKCARFVKSVIFRVYNRWGQEIYKYTGQNGTENNIFIDWDGRDSSGTELSAGIYYYHAEVTFDVVDPSQSEQEVKGWIHLIR